MDIEGSAADEVWRLLEYGSPSDRRTVPIDVTVTIRLGDGRVSGLAGCNRYTGPVLIDEGRIAIGPLAMTMRMCEPEVMAVEGAYASLLDGVDSMVVVEGHLVMSAGDDPILLFERVGFSLPGAWRLDSYNNGTQAMVSVLTGTEITAVFDEEGTVTGSSGCNRYRAEYTAGDGTMGVGLPMGTRMMCGGPPGIMDQERRYLEVLPEIARYEFEDDGTMRCLDTEGLNLLRFSRFAR